MTWAKVGRVSCGQEVGPDARFAPSPQAPRGRPPVLAVGPATALMLLVERCVRERCSSSCGVHRGAGPTTRPLAPQGRLRFAQWERAADSFQTFLLPPAEKRAGALRADYGAALTGRSTRSTRRAPAFSVSLSAVRCFPLWRTLVHSFPSSLRR